MGSRGLERTFAIVVGAVLVVLGIAGSLGNPIVGGPDQTAIIVTGFGHDLVHLVTGALFLHVGLALNGRNRAYGLVGLGVFLLVSGLLSFLTSDLLGLYDEPTSGPRPARPRPARPGGDRHRLDGPGGGAARLR